MASSDTADLPNLGEIIGGVLQRVAVEQQPLLIAVAERLAALRYRSWATAAAAEPRRSQLLACAAREEEIASRVEALYPDAAAIQRALLSGNPDLEEVNRSIFAGRPLPQQFTIQAQGERLGAATWKAFAQHDHDPTRRAAFLACADLEVESALVLEGFLAAER